VATPPTQVSALSGVVAIAAAGEHYLALTSAGEVWAWGTITETPASSKGPLTNSSGPVRVTGLQPVAAIAASRSFDLVLQRDGTVCGWGDGEDAQLDPLKLSSSTPVRIKSWHM
jgi:alpha-tubulin suppressor-like RCC1 family protein